ncbi:MAG: hypothetical protein IPI49_12470 [Myxococcales bacterium]|nr:hypothetical protein [Myxococcales bacterium]
MTLLVYRQQELVAACPGNERCRRDSEGWVLELPLRHDGTYQVVRAQGQTDPFLPARGGSMLIRWKRASSAWHGSARSN